MTMDTAHAAAVDAEVGAELVAPEGMTRLFDAEGQPLLVSDANAEHWIARGFSRTRFDPEGAKADLPALFKGAEDAFMQLIDDVVEKGLIEHEGDAAYVVARTAMDALSDALHGVLRGIHVLYPVAQHEGVLMKGPRLDPAGEPMADTVDEGTVDVGQVEFYESKGWVKA